MDRIIFNTDGVRISKNGHDANSAPPVHMAMFANMTPCVPLISESATFTGNGVQTFSFNSPDPSISPTVILRSTQGVMPSDRTYYATLYPPYNAVTIRNVDGKARTVDFKVLF